MEPILFKHIDEPDIHELGVYRANHGYEALQTAVSEMQPAEVTQVVSDSGLAGRGGAGFPTGRKWSFIPKGASHLSGDQRRRERTRRLQGPGTDGAKPAPTARGRGDRVVRDRLPESVYLYSGRVPVHRRDSGASDCRSIRRRRTGTKDFGSEYNIEIIVHRGAGAYICGEESALLDSLEGYRGFPRLRPPFPAVKGLYGQPTVINNVETITNVPHIVRNGGAWFRSYGTEKSPGTKVCSISGPVNRPGNYEMNMGTPFRVLLEDLAGGMREGRTLKAYIPGGASAPMLPATPENIDIPLSYEAYRDAGSAFGSASFILIPDDVCMLQAQLRLSEFSRTSRVASAFPAARARPGWPRLFDASSAARGAKRICRCCLISAITS
jgi:NADH-quinone oxidoreductase subunit F